MHPRHHHQWIKGQIPTGLRPGRLRLRLVRGKQHSRGMGRAYLCRCFVTWSISHFFLAHPLEQQHSDWIGSPGPQSINLLDLLIQLLCIAQNAGVDIGGYKVATTVFDPPLPPVVTEELQQQSSTKLQPLTQ